MKEMGWERTWSLCLGRLLGFTLKLLPWRCPAEQGFREGDSRRWLLTFTS